MRTGFLVAACAALAAIGSARDAWAQQQPTAPHAVEPMPKLKGVPDLDPLDPATCFVKDGNQTVWISFDWYLAKSAEAGLISDEDYTRIAEWALGQEAALVDPGPDGISVLQFCLNRVEKRKREGF